MWNVTLGALRSIDTGEEKHPGAEGFRACPLGPWGTLQFIFDSEVRPGFVTYLCRWIELSAVTTVEDDGRNYPLNFG